MELGPDARIFKVALNLTVFLAMISIIVGIFIGYTSKNFKIMILIFAVIIVLAILAGLVQWILNITR